jgi:hypothetical protein
VTRRSKHILVKLLRESVGRLEAQAAWLLENPRSTRVVADALAAEVAILRALADELKPPAAKAGDD